MKPALPGTVPVRASPGCLAARRRRARARTRAQTLAWPRGAAQPRRTCLGGARLGVPGPAGSGACRGAPGKPPGGGPGAWEPTLRSPGEQGHGVWAVPDSPGCQRRVPGGGGDGWWRLLPSRARRAPGCPSGRWWLPGDPPSGRLFTRLHGDGKVSKAIPCHSPGRGSGIRSSLEGLGGWIGPGVLPSAPAAPVPGLRTGELWAPGEPWAPLGLASSSSSSSSPRG